jgi:hypothetical protein
MPASRPVVMDDDIKKVLSTPKRARTKVVVEQQPGKLTLEIADALREIRKIQKGEINSLS